MFGAAVAAAAASRSQRQQQRNMATNLKARFQSVPMKQIVATVAPFIELQ